MSLDQADPSPRSLRACLLRRLAAVWTFQGRGADASTAFVELQNYVSDSEKLFTTQGDWNYWRLEGIREILLTAVGSLPLESLRSEAEADAAIAASLRRAPRVVAPRVPLARPAHLKAALNVNDVLRDATRQALASII